MGYGRIHNFSAGPAALPEPVLEVLRDEMLNYKNSGMSIMEMSHRSKEFSKILEKTEALARKLLAIPDDYAVLFMQGGASHQFAMIPVNFLSEGKKADFVHTGYWTKKAISEAKKVGSVSLAFDGEKSGFVKLPGATEIKWTPDAAYSFLCSNNTIYGTQFKQFPTAPTPLIADMSSDYFSRPFDVKKFSLIFGGAQKNLGPSGLTLVIAKKDFVEKGTEKIPVFFQYRSHVSEGSRYNTPPTFAIYTMGLVLEWLERQGGLASMEKRNQEKAAMIYDTIERSQIYKCPLDPGSRSLMNVVFKIKPDAPDSEKIEDRFVAEAEKKGLSGLKGHRAIGGLRASIYNAFPIEGVKALCDFMREFEKKG